MSFRDVIFSNFESIERAQAAFDEYFAVGKFGGGIPYTGSKFEAIADFENPNEFTGRDIVAVSMLSVNVPAQVSIWLLLGEGRGITGKLLEQIPTNLDIWEAEEHLEKCKPLWKLWEKLIGRHGVGDTISSKLLAAKRPRLAPIWDSVVGRVFGASEDYGREFRIALEESELRERVLLATKNAPLNISMLRRVDVVIWMLNRTQR